jgi:hypothetical protein
MHTTNDGSQIHLLKPSIAQTVNENESVSESNPRITYVTMAVFYLQLK